MQNSEDMVACLKDDYVISPFRNFFFYKNIFFNIYGFYAEL